MKLALLPSLDQLLRIECTDDLTLLEVATQNLALDQLFGTDIYTRMVLLSLAKASYIDSAGIGWLVMTHKQFQERGGTLIVHSLAPMVEHVFRVLDLTTLLHVAADEAAARQGAEPALCDARP